MYVLIKIAGDSTTWWTKSLTDASALAEQLAHGPASVPVFYPVIGNLLISRLASVAILDVPPSVSWIPSDTQAPVATLLVQTGPAAGAAGSSDSPGYTLPVGTNLAELASKITSAMSGPGITTVNVSSGPNTGVAVLNGAALTFAVVCPPPAR